MDAGQLKQELQERAQLSPEQSERAAQVALEFFAKHVPGAGDLVQKGGGVDSLAKQLGGLLGR